ncbi:hypothetical protein RxyAA322_29280 [Rubrobacter xylanophilus]|uniref:Uncharacterized protein n=1 Tax=Rubrobacter xylanophilus TaxID=49319 RepID=A0A510HME4_9ACTN|nr:hypothetical protein [Rubrobacter xylanophilus]BBL81074.1 hypothetical protein RxyAA322_29280 [Rubrobacter xylanophilus]
MIRTGDEMSIVEGLELRTPDGGRTTLHEVWGGGPLVLCFLRHLG